MDKEKIILLIVGAIIGFLVSLAKDWLIESKKQKEKEKQFKREKLEELFILLKDEYHDVVKSHGDVVNDMHLSKSTKEIHENYLSGKSDQKRIDMIISLHLKELENYREKMIKIKHNFGNIFISISDSNRQEIKDVLLTNLKNWNSAYDNIKNQISSSSYL